MRSTFKLAAAVAPLLVSVTASAQMTDFLQDSESVKQTFAVYDIQADEAAYGKLRDIVSSAVKVYATKNKVNDEFAPAETPKGSVPQMELRKVSSRGLNAHEPKCDNALFSIDGTNDSYGKYGEMSRVMACLYRYENGYRLNYYGLYYRVTTAGSVQGLGAMLGRAITGAVGLGDSSKFIVTTMDDFHKRIQEAGYPIKLVKLMPKMEGRSVDADPAAHLQSATAVIAATKPQPVAPAAGPSGKSIGESLDLSFIGARKELTAMGFKFYDQDAFVAAAKRNDFITFRLFLAAAGISPSGPDSQGVTAASVAKGQEMQFFLNTFMQAEKEGDYPPKIAN